MKFKLLFLVVIISAVIFSCQKKDSEPAQQDVVFSVVQIDEGLKSTNEIPDCDPTLEPVYAHVKIKDADDVIKDYYPLVFRLDGKLYSQAIKLAPGVYTVTQFVVMDDLGDGQGANDMIYMATPETGSTFAEYVTPTVPFDFTVTAFTKIEIDVEVLCFLEKDYTNFGFFWFNITEIIIREFCFFGDLCVVNPNLWWPSIYGATLADILVDEEAAIRIIVKNGGVEVPNSPFNNLQIYGTGNPLCVQYPDNLNVTGEEFTFELQVWQPDEFGVFGWMTYAVFTSTDDGALLFNGNPIEGIDGVVDFAVGDCSPDSDPIFAWLPAPAPTPDFIPFYIRNSNSTITPPWDTDMNITENALGDGFSAITPRGGQKVGYGTNLFDGVQINDIETVNFNKISGLAGIVPYINMWVTDGVHYAIISSENDYRGTDFGTRQEWKVFEYEVGAGLDWLFDSGAGARDGAQYLTRDGVRVTITDFSDNIVLGDPGVPYPAYVGTGAPRGGYGFQIIFGDTQANYVGDYHLDQLTITVDGVTYNAQN